MVQILSIIFFLGFLQFLLGFSKVPVFLCHPVQTNLLRLCKAKVVVSSEIRTKHITQCEHHVEFLNTKTWGYVK